MGPVPRGRREHRAPKPRVTIAFTGGRVYVPGRSTVETEMPARILALFFIRDPAVPVVELTGDVS